MSICLRLIPSGTLVCTGEDVFHRYGHLAIDDLVNNLDDLVFDRHTTP